MMESEEAVARHYGREDLVERIKAALVEAGLDLSNLTPADLRPFDHMHTGGIEATDALLDQLAINTKTHVADIGCGIGGTVRHLVARFGCPVGGVDLTPQLIDVALELTRLVGYEARCGFKVGSAMELPLHDNAFDVALMQHVGMNIEDKPCAFEEAARILRPGGMLAIYDVMLGSGGIGPDYPVPWADRGETSFLAAPEDYVLAAEQEGFELVTQRDRSEDVLRRLRETHDVGERPDLRHVLLGDNADEKIRNHHRGLAEGQTRLTEMIFRLAS